MLRAFSGSESSVARAVVEELSPPKPRNGFSVATLS